MKQLEHSHLAWETLDRQYVDDFRIFSVSKVRRKTTDGKVGTFYEVNAPDWVTIVPLIYDPDLGPCFVMVRQYRHGSDAVTIEFPAGMVERGEPAEESARRELLEETGFKAGSIQLLGAVSPNPAFMKNTVFTFLAENLELIQDQNLDEHELIDLVRVPVPEVVESMGTGVYNNGIMMISLAFYLRHAGLETGGRSG